MSSESLDALKKLTDTLSLRDQALKEANLFLTKMPFSILALDKNNTIVFANENARKKMVPRKRKLETAEIFSEAMTGTIIDHALSVFDDETVDLKVISEDRTVVTIKPIDYYGNIQYILIVIQEML